MGQEEAESLEAEETIETEEVLEEEVATATDEEEAEAQEFEVVREGSQPAKDSEPAWIKARLSQISAKKNEALKAADTAKTALELERERVKLLEMRIAQQEAAGQQLTPPNPEDHDGGIIDPDYLRKKQEYDDAVIKKLVAEQVAATAKQNAEQANQGVQSQELERKRIKHYQRANEAGAKDFAQTEDKAIELLGDEIADQIVNNFDDSHVLMYYFGKNPGEAASMRALIQANPIQGVAEIGRLRSELKIKPKSKLPPAGPDEDLEGGTLPTQGKRGPKGATYS